MQSITDLNQCIITFSAFPISYFLKSTFEKFKNFIYMNLLFTVFRYHELNLCSALKRVGGNEKTFSSWLNAH